MDKVKTIVYILIAMAVFVSPFLFFSYLGGMSGFNENRRLGENMEDSEQMLELLDSEVYYISTEVPVYFDRTDIFTCVLPSAVSEDTMPIPNFNIAPIMVQDTEGSIVETYEPREYAWRMLIVIDETALGQLTDEQYDILNSCAVNNDVPILVIGPLMVQEFASHYNWSIPYDEAALSGGEGEFIPNTLLLNPSPNGLDRVFDALEEGSYENLDDRICYLAFLEEITDILVENALGMVNESSTESSMGSNLQTTLDATQATLGADETVSSGAVVESTNDTSSIDEALPSGESIAESSEIEGTTSVIIISNESQLQSFISEEQAREEQYLAEQSSAQTVLEGQEATASAVA